MYDKRGNAPAGFSPTIEFSHVRGDGIVIFNSCNTGIKKEIPMSGEEIEAAAAALEQEISTDTMAQPLSPRRYDLGVYRCAQQHLAAR
ncbi:MAG: hypothetical protein WC043_02860 [Pseudobdellovibrionaceae bacterium]